ncbi:MAG: DUF349 domain-containing protein [Atopobiaceae bacterium]|jgi:uncharacterized protein YdcH (DUF465 family)
MNWNTIPTFGDENAEVKEYEHPALKMVVAEVVYHGPNEGADAAAPQSDGVWVGLKTHEGYRLLSWKRPNATDAATEYGFGLTCDPIPLLTEDFAKKQDLISQMKELVERADFKSGGAALRQSMDAWRAIPNWHTPREDDLWNEFQTLRRTFYDGREEARAACAKVKRALIAEAKQISQSSEWKLAAEKSQQLMEQWRHAGSAGHDEDEKLWQEFHELQHTFYERRGEHYKQMRAEHAENKKAKLALIDEAAGVLPEEAWGAKEWKAAGDTMRNLMDRWKEIGPCDREDSDAIWEKFNGFRQAFFAAQKAHREELAQSYAANAQAKEALIERAHELADAQNFSPDATEAARSLDGAWKEIGFAGHDKNDALWESFRAEKERFWSARRAYFDAKHEQWLAKTREAKERKQSQIARLTEQIERLQSRIDHATVMVSESQLNEWEDWILEKKERIGVLESQIQDIDKQLGE